MNRTTILLAAITVSATMFTGCSNIIKISSKDNSPSVTKEIQANEPFTSIVAQSGIDVVYTDGPSKITMKAPKEIADQIKITISDGRLIISQKGNSIAAGFKTGFYYDDNTVLEISYPGVNSFTTQGSGDIKISSVSNSSKEISLLSQGSGDIISCALRGHTLSIMTQGSGDVAVEAADFSEIAVSTQGSGDITVKKLKATNLSAMTEGSGDITLSGECAEAELSTYGSGDINAGIKCDRIKTSEKGSGDIHI